MTAAGSGPGSFLGYRSAFGIPSQGSSINPNPFGFGNFTATFDPITLAFSANLVECYHVAIVGPTGSQLQVYIDNTFYDTTNRGDINSWDPVHPLLLRGGQSLLFHWSSGALPVAFVNTWWRIPTDTIG